MHELRKPRKEELEKNEGSMDESIALRKKEAHLMIT